MATRKPRTRGNREGAPYQRGSDGKWVAVVYLPNGKRRPVYGNSRAEVVAKRKKVEEEIAAGQPITAGRTENLGDYLLDVWLKVTLPQRVAAGRLAESTLDSYREKIELHVVPHLGKVPLHELSTAHIRTWLLELAAKPSGKTRRKARPGETVTVPKLSARTISYAHAVLRKAINDAVDDERVKRNVLLLVDAPRVEKKEFVPLTKDEAARLLVAAADDRLWCYWITVLALGLRRGEGLGMRWSHIDFEAGTVRLEKSIQRLRGELDESTGKRRGQLVEKALKTVASMATVAVPATALQALKEHRKAQTADRLAAKVWVDPDLMFCTGLGTPLEPRNVNRAWYALTKRAGVRQGEEKGIRLHDLRHATATFLFAEGADIKLIQSVLRHARTATTSDIYTHVLAEVQRGAADTMDGVLSGLMKPRAKGKRAVS